MRTNYLIAALLIFMGVLPPSHAIMPRSNPKKAAYDFQPARLSILSITMKESQSHVEILASEQFRGRETGKPGQWLAAKYIATEFANYGLQPSGSDHSFYQNFSIRRCDLKQAALSIETEARFPLDQIAFSLETDFIPFHFTGEDDVTAPVVFVGYGISAPEYGYDDYKDVNVRDKVVLILRHEPQENDPNSVFDGVRPTKHAFFETKVKNAGKHGAVGVLVVTDPLGGHSELGPQGDWPSLHKGVLSPNRWQFVPDAEKPCLPALWISTEVADTILRQAGPDLAERQRQIDRTLTPLSAAIKGVATHIEVVLDKEIRKTQNVLGLLEGSGPDLHQELVVIGAHYDHIGVKNGLIHSGADDNASGTAGMLEIAEAFSELPLKPRRSILFVAFTAEELGLLGSQYYVEHPLVPLERTVTMINLDMISRNDANAVTVVGSNRSPELHEINLSANAEIGLEFRYDGERYFNRSDQANFAKHHIPVIFYNTNVHPDYHRPSDVAEKINPEKLARIARLAFLVAWKVANLEPAPTYHPLKITH